MPRTVKFRDIKASAAATRAQLRGERANNKNNNNAEEPPLPVPNGKKHKSSSASRPSSGLNGGANLAGLLGAGNSLRPQPSEEPADPNDQLETEMRQARGGEDVDMTG